ncbi:MAG: amidase [Burkholderiales bacterium]|jgi:Asp-tRNA(Asn)/Glu-tRNA(Gln) amidotransferase A subunit family amidase|nr:amidase [Burkholderiales bacterium]
MIRLNELSAVDAAEKLAAREISAEQYLRACLERIDEREKEVRAFAFINREGALARARELDAGPVLGPLHGLTLGIKDVFDTFDMPTQGGSKAFEGYRPSQDAGCVAYARKMGAIVLGKTMTAELATFPPNETHNPLNLAHTPGGSSSGSAAAVADFMVAAATGSQQFGSLIRPAGYCGVVAYKPTYNLIPKRGVWANSDSCDTVGVMARTVPDVALVTSAMIEFPGLRAFVNRADDVPAPKVALCRTYQWDKCDEHMKAAFEAAGEALSAAGAKVAEIALPEPFRGMADAQSLVSNFEMSRGFSDVVIRFGAKLRKPLYDRSTAGLKITGEDYQRAQKLGRECRQLFADVLGDCDVMLTPAATGEAPKGIEYTGDPIMNGVWSFLHTPCVSVNGGYGPNGLPLGMQVVGRLDDDARTLACAHWIHRHLGR